MAAENVVEIIVKAKDATAPGMAEVRASAAGAAEGADALAAAQDRLTEATIAYGKAQSDSIDAELRLDALQKTEGASADALAAARDKVTQATIRQADAQIRLVQAEREVAAAESEAGGAAEVTAAKADASGGMLAAAGAKMKMALVGVAIGAGLAVKAASDFQDQTTHLVTDAGESAKNLGLVQQGILAVSAATGQSASAITDAMYHVESAGFHAASGLAVLKVAAEGARVGGADLDTIGKTLVGTLNAYGMQSSNAATQTKFATSMMNQLIATVGAGDMRMQDLAASLGNVAPVAAAAKISFAQVGGALATMTSQNMSAQQATQDLRHTILSMENPNKVQQKELAALGLTAKQVQQSLGQRGLAATLAMVAAAAKSHAGALGQTYVQALAKAMGGTTGLNTALMLTGPNMAAFTKNASAVAAAAAKGGKSVDNWSVIQGTFKFKMDQAKVSIEDTGIALGSALLPAVSAILGPVAHFLALIASNKAASIALATVIGGLLAGAIGVKMAGALRDMASGIKSAGEGASWLVGKIIAMTTAQEAQTAATEAGTVAQEGLDVAEEANPIGLIILAIIALIAIIYELVKHWHTVEEVAKKVWKAVLEAVKVAWDWIKSHWPLLLAILTGPIGLAVLAIVKYWHDITAAVAAAIDWVKSHWPLLLAILTGPIGMAALFIIDHWHQIVNGARSMIGDLVSFFTSLPGRILHALGDLGHLLWNAGASVIQGLINGIENAVPGLHSALSWVSSLIPSWKGPMSKDKQLLAPTGQAIMGGLVGGLQAGMPGLRSQLQRTTQAITGGVRGTGGGYGGGPAPRGGDIIFRFTGSHGGLDSLFMRWLRETVRQEGGDPSMFQRKVAFQ